MKFKFSRQNLSPKEQSQERILEIIPGLLSWSVLLGIPALSAFSPHIASGIIIAFMLYWLLRMFYIAIFLVLSYFRLACEKQTDWQARIAILDQGGNPQGPHREIKGQISDWLFSRDLKRYRKSKAARMASADVCHLVILTVSNESSEIVAASVQGLVQSRFAAQQIIPCIALEASAPETIRQDIFDMQRNQKNHFKDFLVFIHPEGIAGEAKVKGANATYAARQAEIYFQEHKIPFENIIVSCFDVDTIADPNYFGCLTYSFMICPERDRASFQPIPVYYNNIWEVPGFARVLEMGASFFQMIEVTNPEKLVTFSSHSMSFKALTEIDYWPVDMISDDSAIFWKALLHYDGHYRVIPIHVTVSMDIAVGKNTWKTITGIYKQKRRWAWGVENFPILMRGFMHNQKMPLLIKLRHGIKMLEGNLSWATIPFLLTLVGWLPLLWSNNAFANTTFYYGSNRVVSVIFGLSTIALLTTILISVALLPKKVSRYSLFWVVIHALEWCLLPFVFIIFSAAPALEAQTRLMLGKYMDFAVSKKRASA